MDFKMIVVTMLLPGLGLTTASKYNDTRLKDYWSTDSLLEKKIATAHSNINPQYLLSPVPCQYRKNLSEHNDAANNHRENYFKLKSSVQARRHSAFRSYDGSGNNLYHETWGAANTCMKRLLPASYSDGKYPASWIGADSAVGFRQRSAQRQASKHPPVPLREQRRSGHIPADPALGPDRRARHVVHHENYADQNSRVGKIFTDVKILQSTYGVKDRQQFSCLRSLSGKPWASSLSNPQAQQALVRLYGTGEHIAKTSRVFLLWSRFAGALTVCFKRWRRAGPARDVRAVPWTPPAHWRDKGKRVRALTFELHLKTRWACSLGRLTGMPASSITWLLSLDAEGLKALLGRLPLYSGTQLEAYRAAPLSPWDADADSYLRALARGKPGMLPLVPYTCPPTSPPPRPPPRGEMMLLLYFIEMMFRSFVREDCRRAGSSSDTDDEVDQEEGLRNCANCSVPEPKPGCYNICKLCKNERVSMPRFYCSRQCREYDWKRFHKREHKRN